MNDEQPLGKHDRILAGLVLSLQAAAMQHLGKITSLQSGKVERDLEQARGTIDVLEMLKAKCRTGTAPDVARLMDTVVMELQMNYLDEVRKDREGGAAGEEGEEGEGAGGAGGASEDTGPGEGAGEGEKPTDGGE